VLIEHPMPPRNRPHAINDTD